jgi:hypothetical protein
MFTTHENKTTVLLWGTHTNFPHKPDFCISGVKEFSGQENKKSSLVFSLLKSLKMSDSLVWHLIRDNNSFLVKRERTNRAGSVQFSSERGNVLGVNTFKYSGLANKNTIDISTDAAKKHAVVLTKMVLNI